MTATVLDVNPVGLGAMAMSGAPRYAGFWRRVLAVLLDALFIVVLGMIVGVILPANDSVSYANRYISLKMSGNLKWQSLSGLLYTIAFWTLYGATPGKMLLGLRIVQARTLDRIGLGRSIVRYLAYFVSSFVLMLGFIWAAFDRRHQGWHDKIAGTVVIQARG